MKKIQILIAIVFLAIPALMFSQSNLPSFSFYDLDGNTFTSDQLKDKATMIMLFDPWCDHCNTQAETVSEYAEELTDVQLVFVTIIPEKEAVQEFYQKHFEGTGLDIHMLQDLDFQFETYFGYTDDALNIYLYKKGARNPKYFGNEVDGETLLKFL